MSCRNKLPLIDPLIPPPVSAAIVWGNRGPAARVDDAECAFDDSDVDQALGGRVEPAGFCDVGVRRILLHDDSPVARLGGRASFDTFVYHSEHVPEVPPGCAATFTSDGCALEGFSHAQRPIHAVRFHPEIGADRVPAILVRNTDVPTLVGDPTGLDASRAHDWLRRMVDDLCAAADAGDTPALR